MLVGLFLFVMGVRCAGMDTVGLYLAFPVPLIVLVVLGTDTIRVNLRYVCEPRNRQLPALSFKTERTAVEELSSLSGRWLLASIVLESIIVQDTRIASVLYQAACIAVQCTCGSSSSVRICPGIADCGFGFAGLVLMLDPCTSRYVRVYEYSGQRSVHQQIFVRFVRLLIVYSFMTGECRPLLWGLRTRAPCLLPGTFYFARSKSIRSAAFRPLI